MGTSQSKHIEKDPSRVGTAVPSVPNNLDWGRCKSYDYVIVGGGTAGCVIASRLSEERGVTVLLVEAGASHRGILESRMPFAFPKLFKTSYDWDYETRPQPALNNRIVPWPRGKLLGGSSSLNGCVYHHCAPEDFDEWKRMGANDWGYDELKPYFRKSENYVHNPLCPDVDTSLRGNRGPWQTSHPRIPPSSKTIIKTCESIGIPYNPDVNTPTGTVGVTEYIQSVDSKGERSSAATAYLTPDVLARPNLTVLVNIRTERVFFGPSSTSGKPRAVGIQISNGPEATKYRVAAKKEIILCAGVVATPQLLMISGIGPKYDLVRLDITPVSELDAVGRNLSDHISYGPLTLRAKPGQTIDSSLKPLGSAVAALQWLIFGNGPFATSPGPVIVFFRSDNAKLPYGLSSSVPVEDLTSGPGAPDIELAWFPFVAVAGGFTKLPSNTYGFTLGGIALKPKSVGTISLTTASVWDKPDIDANYLSCENDLNILVKALRLSLKLARTRPFLDILDLNDDSNDKTNIFWPGDADPDKLTDEDIRTWIRANATTPWHPVSSARMGESAGDSVVDYNLCVHGVDSLRVMDASVFPSQVSGHPAAVVVAMAEKTADMLKRSSSM